MKIQFKNIVTDGELFINTREQCDRLNIKFKENAYYQSFIGYQPGYVSKLIRHHLIPFENFIVKNTDEMESAIDFEDHPYYSIDRQSVKILSTYTPEQIKIINEMRSQNKPISEAFKFLSLTTPKEQENLVKQWYSNNDKVTISDDVDKKLTTIDYVQVTRKNYHLLFNYDLTDEQVDHINKLISEDEDSLSRDNVEDDPILPNDLDWEYVDGPNNEHDGHEITDFKPQHHLIIDILN